MSDLQPVNQAVNGNQTLTNGFNLSQSLLYRHRFDLPGQTLSINASMSANRKTGSSELSSIAHYDTETNPFSQTIDQEGRSVTNGYTLSSNVVYTEPVTVNSLLKLNYSPSYTSGSADAMKYDYDPATGTYALFDSAFSNSYDNRYWVQKAGIGYLYRQKALNVTTGVSYQISSLDGQRVYPWGVSTSRTFYTFLPAVSLNYAPEPCISLRMFYRTSTQAPSIAQLQDVVDNSNPLFLSEGNPDLRQSYSHTLITRYNTTQADRSRSRI